MKRNALKYSGISLIEVVIALFVFGIGILWILRLITQNIATVDDIKIKTQATLLSKEGLEIMIHLRNTNLKKSQPWNCFRISNDECDEYFLSWEQQKFFTVDMNFSGTELKKISLLNSWDFEELFISSQLWFLSGWIIGSSQSGSKSFQMARYIKIQPVIFSWTIRYDDFIIRVQSYVLYKKWSTTWFVMLETFLWNWR